MTSALAAVPVAELGATRDEDDRPGWCPPAGLTPLAVALLTEFRPWAHQRVTDAGFAPAAVYDVLYRLEDLATRHLMHEPATGTTGRPALSVVPG